MNDQYSDTICSWTNQYSGALSLGLLFFGGSFLIPKISSFFAILVFAVLKFFSNPPFSGQRRKELRSAPDRWRAAPGVYRAQTPQHRDGHGLSQMKIKKQPKNTNRSKQRRRQNKQFHNVSHLTCHYHPRGVWSLREKHNSTNIIAS